jgi:DNA replication protein DnaC
MRALDIPPEYGTAEIVDFSPFVQRIAREWPDRSPFFGVFGGPGRGKTRLVWAVARALHRHRRFVTVVDCRQAQVEWSGSQRREDMMRRWTRAGLLALDDIAGGSMSPGWRATLEKVIDARKQENMPTMIVTMIAGEEFETIFGMALRSRMREYRWLNWPAKEPDRRPRGNDTKGGE